MTEEQKQQRVGAQSGQEDLLTLDAAADYLAVSKPTLYRMLDRGEVRGTKVGRQWRFRPSELDAYLSRGPVAMTLTTVPIEVLDRELDYFAGELARIGAPVPEGIDERLDPWEQKVTLLLRRIARLAAASQGSDIHLEPFRDDNGPFGLIRFRIDGMLHEIRRLPFRVYEAIIMRCRMMTHAEPLDRPFIDALIDLSDQDGGLELRVSIMPGSYGDTLTARLMVVSPHEPKTLDDLGLSPEDLARLLGWLKQPSGLILTTGPTGAGKTVLLYKMLQEIAGPQVKTVTIEDPVESHLPWVSQMECKPGVTFSAALRHFLRQDPDIILIGEIRDLETIQAALTAAETGHLVFAPLHVNDTVRAIERVVEVFPTDQQEQIAIMMTKPANRVIAQRLVRVLCPHCKEAEAPSDANMAEIRQRASAGGYVIPENAVFYRAVGCDACRGMGYLGRTGIFELLELTFSLREAILRKAPYEELLTIAVKDGMHTMIADGIRKAAEGMTTVEEVLRVTQ